MIYQHAAAEADQKIANLLDQRMREARTMPATKANGTLMARGGLGMITVWCFRRWS
jgi:hypothetical protein